MTANFALTPYNTPDKPVATGSFTAPDVTEQQNNVLLWYSGIVPPQGAWFTMNVTSASATTPFVFDYLIWNEQMSPPKTIAVTTSSLTNQLTLSSTSSAQTPLPTPAGPPQTQDSDSDSYNHHTGAIVGGVVGGVVGVIILAALFFFWCRRRRNRAPIVEEGSSCLSLTPMPSLLMVLRLRDRGRSCHGKRCVRCYTVHAPARPQLRVCRRRATRTRRTDHPSTRWHTSHGEYQQTAFVPFRTPDVLLGLQRAHNGRSVKLGLFAAQPSCANRSAASATIRDRRVPSDVYPILIALLMTSCPHSSVYTKPQLFHATGMRRAIDDRAIVCGFLPPVLESCDQGRCRSQVHEHHPRTHCASMHQKICGVIKFIPLATQRSDTEADQQTHCNYAPHKLTTLCCSHHLVSSRPLRILLVMAMQQYMNLTLDDGDLVSLHYVGNWTHQAFDNHPPPVFHATLSQSIQAGSSMWAGTPSASAISFESPHAKSSAPQPYKYGCMVQSPLRDLARYR